MLVGWCRRAWVLSTKLDACQRCAAVRPHLLVRTTLWGTLMLVPLLLVQVWHELICTTCGTQTRVGVRAGFLSSWTHRLPLNDRPRPDFSEVLAAGEIEGRRPTTPSQFWDPLTPVKPRGAWPRYLRVYPVVVLAALILVLANQELVAGLLHQ
jgi:hypothetical protein